MRWGVSLSPVHTLPCPCAHLYSATSPFCVCFVRSGTKHAATSHTPPLPVRSLGVSVQVHTYTPCHLISNGAGQRRAGLRRQGVLGVRDRSSDCNEPVTHATGCFIHTQQLQQQQRQHRPPPLSATQPTPAPYASPAPSTEHLRGQGGVCMRA